MNMPKDYAQVFLHLTEMLIWDAHQALQENTQTLDQFIFLDLIKDYRKRLLFIIEKNPVLPDKTKKELNYCLQKLNQTELLLKERPHLSSNENLDKEIQSSFKDFTC